MANCKTYQGIKLQELWALGPDSDKHMSPPPMCVPDFKKGKRKHCNPYSS